MSKVIDFDIKLPVIKKNMFEEVRTK